MPALGAPELIIILVIIVLIFGVGKLPEVGSALGKGIKEFRKSTDDDQDESPAKPVAAVEAPRPSVAAVEAPRPATPASDMVRPSVSTPDTVRTEVIRPQSNGTLAYTIQSGDTLDTIAERHGVTVEALMQANGYSQRDRVLYAGDLLQVPRTTTNAS